MWSIEDRTEISSWLHCKKKFPKLVGIITKKGSRCGFVQIRFTLLSYKFVVWARIPALTKTLIFAALSSVAPWYTCVTVPVAQETCRTARSRCYRVSKIVTSRYMLTGAKMEGFSIVVLLARFTSVNAFLNYPQTSSLWDITVQYVQISPKSYSLYTFNYGSIYSTDWSAVVSAHLLL